RALQRAPPRRHPGRRARSTSAPAGCGCRGTAAAGPRPPGTALPPPPAPLPGGTARPPPRAHWPGGRKSRTGTGPPHAPRARPPRRPCLSLPRARRRVRFGQAAGNRGRDPARRTRLVLARPLERLLRLLVTAQLVQRDRAVELRFDVAVVQRDRLLELGQRRLGLPQHAQAEPGVVADVREPGAHFQHLRETREGRPVVAAVVGLPARPDQLFDVWIHAKKIIRAAGRRHGHPPPAPPAFRSPRSAATTPGPPAAAPC